MPMRHGLTLGELGHWFVDTFKLDVDYRVIEMEGCAPDAAPGFGWPLGERTWVNPSPNAPNLWMARAYAGTVMLEGTTLSEGPRHDPPARAVRRARHRRAPVIAEMRALAPQWLEGCRLRDCWFEPTFHKHVGQLCSGVQIHTEDPAYDHAGVPALAAAGARPSRRSAGSIPTTRCGATSPTNTSSASSPSTSSTAGPLLREWVDDPAADAGRPRRADRCRTSRPGSKNGGSTCSTDIWTQSPHADMRAYDDVIDFSDRL